MPKLFFGRLLTLCIHQNHGCMCWICCAASYFSTWLPITFYMTGCSWFDNLPFYEHAGCLSLAADDRSGFILLGRLLLYLEPKPCQTRCSNFGLRSYHHPGNCVNTPQEQILFGILHFTGLAYLITACLRPAVSKLPALPACAVAFLLFAFTKGIYYGYFGFLHTPLWYLPDRLYQFPILFILGLPTPDFYSGDYFPLIPWFFLFLVGYFGGPAVLKSKPFAKIQQWYLPPFNWIGRRTLFLYMLHQPVIFGALSLYFSIS